jgi:hypothetical protein
MGDLSLFIPITKVDATQHLVYGVATAEVEDRTGEICDYASTKPHYQRWSEEIAQSTGGKSRGNLRAMHGSVAAGKVTAITFNDDARQIEISAKVVDAAEWIKVTEGVYTGFSQGGTYERRWTDEAGLMRYTAIPSEISLVDLPCLAAARFEMIKADGTPELRGFEPGSSVVAKLEALVGNLEWLESLSASDLGAAPDLADMLSDIVGVSDRLAEILRAMTGDIEPRRGRTRASRDGIRGVGRAAKAARDRIRPDVDRDQQHSEIHPRGYGPVVEGATPHPATSSMPLTVQKRLDTLAAVLADVLQRVKNIEQQPLPLPFSGGGRAVAKHDDAAFDRQPEARIDSLLSEPEALSVLAIRLAQRNGRTFLK